MKFDSRPILVPLLCAFLLTAGPQALADRNSASRDAQNTSSNSSSISNSNSNKNSTSDGAIFTPAIGLKLDKFLNDKYAEGNMVGYGFEVVEHGHVVYQKTFGKEDLVSGAPVTGRTIFGLASITKTFTGLAILYLMENHKLTLYDRISNYLKDAPKEWKNVTVLELASMTAGFPHDVKRQDLSWKEQYEEIKHEPLDFEPGTKYQYSNLGYRLLGNIIEKITGHNYLSVIHDVVLDPFDMTMTGPVEQWGPTAHLATPYVRRPNGFAPVKYKPSIANYSAGMLCSSLDDMGKYASMLMENRFPRSSSFGWLWFTRPTLKNGTPNPWAFGWGYKAQGNGLPERDAMNGGLPGVSSSIIVCPSDRLAIIALSNVRSKAIASIAPQALRIIYNQAPGLDAPLEGEPMQPDESR